MNLLHQEQRGPDNRRADAYDNRRADAYDNSEANHHYFDWRPQEDAIPEAKIRACFRRNALAATLAALGSAVTASCTLNTKGECVENCAVAENPDSGSAGMAGAEQDASGGQLEASAGHGGTGGGIDGGEVEDASAGQGGTTGGPDGSDDQSGYDSGTDAETGGDVSADGEDGEVGSCAGITVILNNMAEYEYKVWRGGCDDAHTLYTSIETNLPSYETGLTELCLKIDDIMLAQVYDNNDKNSLEFTATSAPAKVQVSTAANNQILTNDLFNIGCGAESGFTTYDIVNDDQNPAPNEYKFNGNLEMGHLPPANFFRVIY